VKERILYISPHFSTGGLPQYLLKKIEAFHQSMDVYCVEYNFYGDAYVVQRNKVISILGEKFIPLGENKSRIIDLIEEIKPNIIHIEEIGETFIDTSILNQIYSPDRKYYICETCHSSQIDPSIKTHRPDKFIMVSKWIQEKFNILGVPSEILEYPILANVPEKANSISALGLDPMKKHIINVGLFTPGKNQGELIDFARSLEPLPIDFHFIGKQAPNFSSYWEPLMENLPKNCKVWGERSDVDLFYQAADLFVFTSLMELNPLCIKEALSWNLPVLFRNLNTYSNFYDDKQNSYYLSESRGANIIKILEILGFLKKV